MNLDEQKAATLAAVERLKELRVMVNMTDHDLSILYENIGRVAYVEASIKEMIRCDRSRVQWDWMRGTSFNNRATVCRDTENMLREDRATNRIKRKGK